MRKLCTNCLNKVWHLAPVCEHCGYDFGKNKPPKGSIKSLPYPYFGGKRTVANEIWQVFGRVNKYVEPFLGGAALLVHRPSTDILCVANDSNCWIINFWRAVQAAPEEVVAGCEWMINEVDLNSRESWMMSRAADLKRRLMADPFHFSTQLASWWVVGQCAVISMMYGSGTGSGHRKTMQGINRRIHLGRKNGVHSGEGVSSLIGELKEAVKNVVFCCGTWDRVCTDAALGDRRTALFLDPPYESFGKKCYGEGSDLANLSKQVAVWASQAVKRKPDLLVGICEYSGVLEGILKGWSVYQWEHSQGYNKGHKNKGRERIFFSPNCQRLRKLEKLRLIG